MSCNCNCNNRYYNNLNCENPSSLATSLYIQNAWNIPACDETAALAVPNLQFALVGAYLWSPSYGYYKITSFNPVTGQMLILNECLDGNSDPGTLIPANTQFLLATSPTSLLFPTWVTVAPVLTQGVAITVDGTQVSAWSKRVKIGNFLAYQFNIKAGSAGTGAQPIQVALPVAGIGSGGAYRVAGSAHFFDASTNIDYVLAPYMWQNNSLEFAHDTSGGDNFGVGPAITIASGDIISGSVFYEVA